MKIIPKEIRENNDSGAYVLLLFQIIIGVGGLSSPIISILSETYGLFQKIIIGVLLLTIYFYVKGVVKSTKILIQNDKIVDGRSIVGRELANISFIVSFIGIVVLIIYFVDMVK